MKVLITRNAAQAGSLENKLSAAGAEVTCIPTISIQDPDDWSSFDQAVEELQKFNWILFTSANAVKQTQKRLSQLGYQFQDFPHLQFGAVGNQTAQLMEEAGWPVDIVPERFQAEGLLDELLRRGVQDNKIWFPRALKARKYLIPELESAGAEVTLTPVYQNMVPLENREILHQTLQAKDLDWITFTSSSTVSNFFKILGERDSVELPKIASIGTKTTETLEAFSIKPVFTAIPQNLEGLCQGILDWEKAQKK
ncbi:MAG: hypothetical protein COB67_06520 [SAR324 cluster bacterium]|uniref:Uroporphyrinogen-III synthase n=1 Tax=SAR324 cluster bacterium TaxID=2024889 RepID=A0A2A4T3Y0_9DELT|nr:MAG: hypothetical protein COB67_06520 [SAR324 cluster bacterium]